MPFQARSLTNSVNPSSSQITEPDLDVLHEIIYGAEKYFTMLPHHRVIKKLKIVFTELCNVSKGV